MKLLFLVLSFLILSTCSKNSINNENCKYLLNVNVNISINLSLPQYSQLQFAGNSVYIANEGNKGVIIAYTGADFFAWDAADPNHIQSSCSILENSGLEATCGCADHNKYSLVNGQPLNDGTLFCGLKNYRVEQSGNTLLISN